MEQKYEYRVRRANNNHHDPKENFQDLLNMQAIDGWALKTVLPVTDNLSSTVFIFERMTEEYKRYNDEITKYLKEN